MKEMIMKQLSTVMDPELQIDIVSLGLVYRIELDESRVKIIMTLTTPGCPLAPVIDRMVKEAVAEVKGIKKMQIETELVWDPPWTQDLMTEEAKLTLGFL